MIIVICSKKIKKKTKISNSTDEKVNQQLKMLKMFIYYIKNIQYVCKILFNVT